MKPSKPSLVLPEITYPLEIDTIGKDLAIGNRYYVECLGRECRHRGWLDLEAIAIKKGVDYPNGRESLLQVVYCPECRDAGRPDKDLVFTVHPPTAAPKGNAYAKAKGG